MPDNTDITDSGAGDTDNSGQPAQDSGLLNQEGFAAKLQEYEAKLAQYADLEHKHQTLEEQAKKEAAQARRWEASYKSLQSSTTASLQEAARQRDQAGNQQRIQEELSLARSEMTQMRDGLAFVISKMVDEDSAKEFQLRQREARLQQMETAAQNRQATAQQVIPQQPYVDPDTARKNFLDHYFPGSGIDPNDSNIDWGDTANSTPEAFGRFTRSVYQIINDRQQTKEAPVQSEAQQLLEQLRKDRDELQKTQAQVLEDAKAQTRREVEERLRKMGVDAGSGSSASASTQKAATRLQELDDSSLMTGDPASTKRAARKMEEELRSLRNDLLRQ